MLPGKEAEERRRKRDNAEDTYGPFNAAWASPGAEASLSQSDTEEADKTLQAEDRSAKAGGQVGFGKPEPNKDLVEPRRKTEDEAEDPGTRRTEEPGGQRYHDLPRHTSERYRGPCA
ncbi:uncharacterized protein LOC144753500 [Lissotriton helveticus]